MSTTQLDANDRTVVERHDPLVGAVLDQRFRIDFQLAAGGFGAIYRATDLLSDAEVALKVLHPQLTRDPSVVERFRREGKTLANLRDPHTITAYEVGEAPDGTLYIVLELLHGESLYHRYRAHGRLPWPRVVRIALGVCSSLAEAHALGVIHRDLKPANIHLEEREGDPDFVKVLDFGIAKIVQGGGGERNELTQAGQMIGTIDYMSPEQMVGGELTAASDIYTLGVVMYEMIAGRTPFAQAQNATAILAAVLTQSPDPISLHAEVPPALDQIIARCLEREPSNRYGDVSELADVLGAVLARATPAVAADVPRAEFETTTSTTEATRVDVRVSASSAPVLDARGPRGWSAAGARMSEPLTPTPAASFSIAGARRPAQAQGSQHAIDPRPRHARPSPLPGAMSTPPGAIATPPGLGGYPPGPGWLPPGHAPAPHGGGFLPAGPPLVPPEIAYPRSRPSTQPPRYDMNAATSRDAMVRRIVWLAVFVAFAIGVVILR